MPLNLRRSNGDLQEQTREARRFLMQAVRNDWEYPEAPHVLPFDYPTTTTSKAPSTTRSSTTSPSTPSPSTPAVATTQVNAHMDSQALSPPPPRTDLEPTAWRERTYSSYESSGTEDNSKSTSASYKFDTPDSFSANIADRNLRLKRKRQERLEEEMNWNIGLAHWNAQRNAWTGAQQRSLPIRPSPTCRPSSTSSRPKSTTSSKSTTSTASTTSIPDQRPSTPTSATQETALVVPVAPKILPDHPVRSRITTSTYNDIYTKIILQGRTPSIPINLHDITRALVQGWKEEGNWPPRITPAEPSFVKKKVDHGLVGRGEPKHRNLTKGVQAVGRVLGFGGPKLPIETGRGQGKV